VTESILGLIDWRFRIRSLWVGTREENWFSCRCSNSEYRQG